MNPLLNPNSPAAGQHEKLIPAVIKPYTKKDLKHLYSIPEKSLSNWLADLKHEIGERRGRFYNVLQIQIIFSKLGVPYVEKREKE